MAIKSQAQFDMISRCATDPDYAAQRKITQQTAQQMLLDYKNAGSPALVPGRVTSPSDRGPTPRLKRKSKISGLNLFGKTGRL